MPSPPEQPKTLTSQQARQGKELGTMRHVLGISLILAIVAGIAVYFAVLS